MAVTNKSVVLPKEYTREIFRGIVGRSKALELGRRLRDMRTYELVLNVNSVLPVAGWVKKSQTTPNTEGAEINRKPYSEYAYDGVSITAEELAVIIPVAEVTIADVEDIGVDLLAQISEEVIGAFQEKIDAAALFGVDAPWQNYTGLVAEATAKGATVKWDGSVGQSFYNAISAAMSYVVESGFTPNAILGGPSILAAFRNSLTTLGINVTDQGEIGALARHVDYTGGFDSSVAFAIVGDFKYLVYSIREDLRMKLLTEGVIQNPNTGDIVYNLGQQDMVALRFTMRLGFALPNPKTRVGGENGYPFAVITKE